jgi:hypothetical protein
VPPSRAAAAGGWAWPPPYGSPGGEWRRSPLWVWTLGVRGPASREVNTLGRRAIGPYLLQGLSPVRLPRWRHLRHHGARHAVCASRRMSRQDLTPSHEWLDWLDRGLAHALRPTAQVRCVQLIAAQLRRVCSTSMTRDNLDQDPHPSTNPHNNRYVNCSQPWTRQGHSPCRCSAKLPLLNELAKPSAIAQRTCHLRRPAAP